MYVDFIWENRFESDCVIHINRRKNNIKMYATEIGYKDATWTEMAHHRVSMAVFVVTNVDNWPVNFKGRCD
jgi:hypothetical protein